MSQSAYGSGENATMSVFKGFPDGNIAFNLPNATVRTKVSLHIVHTKVVNCNSAYKCCLCNLSMGVTHIEFVICNCANENYQLQYCKRKVSVMIVH